ncbi:hypothetical protein MTR67_011860 [Solanum verrucosum]|uniref:Uncharacterized protein n=1 Tax=Solanum verrucosum TaxID=315347 RepID=A0AAF0TME1_SOLVR|nr:hypothetical protein MTR67_011860 [Solanum verrucosum]
MQFLAGKVPFANALVGAMDRAMHARLRDPSVFVWKNDVLVLSQIILDDMMKPGKCLYTTVREVVENALDSAESISELPVVEITIEEIGRSKFNSMIGLADHERRDEALYDDFETAKAREKRLAKEARVLEIQAKNVALGKKVKDPAATKAAKGREASYYRVTCKDNGRGMQHDDILNMFGRGYGCRIDVEFSASLALLEHVIEATKYFIIIGGFSMRQYISELMPLIVEALLDWVAITKYELDVSTFGQVVLSTGYVITPYNEYPQLLGFLMKLLNGELA